MHVSDINDRHEFEMRERGFTLPSGMNSCPDWWKNYVKYEGNPLFSRQAETHVVDLLIEKYNAVDAYDLKDNRMVVEFPDAMTMMAFIWRWEDDN